MSSYARALRRSYGLKLIAWVRAALSQPHAKIVHWEQRGMSDEQVLVKDNVCNKWVEKIGVDNVGRTVSTPMAEIHPVITCTCGADENNKKVNQVCDELEKLMVEFMPRPKKKK